jgi:hypothetical protein
MQTRSARAKPWLAKSPGATTPSLSRRAGSASDRTQLAADILNEDRVALAARLRDPGDDPPPNYFRESTAVDDEPCASPLQPLFHLAHMPPSLNVSRLFGVKATAKECNYDVGHVVGVSEPEEWREICTLQTVGSNLAPTQITFINTLTQEWLGACVKISRFLISMQS